MRLLLVSILVIMLVSCSNTIQKNSEVNNFSSFVKIGENFDITYRKEGVITKTYLNVKYKTDDYFGGSKRNFWGQEEQIEIKWSDVEKISKRNKTLQFIDFLLGIGGLVSLF